MRSHGSPRAWQGRRPRRGLRRAERLHRLPPRRDLAGVMGGLETVVVCAPCAPAADLLVCRVFLVFGVRLEYEVADALLASGVGDRTKQRERALFALDGVLTGGEGHVADGSAPALPDPEANELEALERPAGEV